MYSEITHISATQQNADLNSDLDTYLDLTNPQYFTQPLKESPMPMAMADVQEPVPVVPEKISMALNSASGGMPIIIPGYQFHPNPNPSEPHLLPESINVRPLKNGTPQTSSRGIGSLTGSASSTESDGQVINIINPKPSKTAKAFMKNHVSSNT